jgi:carbonic anhydrase/acetyltransferase-like protein (isoleucine patch superfamily)
LYAKTKLSKTKGFVMSIYEFKGKSPKISENCFIAESSDIIGDVQIGSDASIWFGTVIRGDLDPIKVGTNSNVQENSSLHTTHGIPLTVGDNVTIGHSVTLHSCVVEDNCLIGMGSTILDKAVIGAGSLVAAGSVVTPGKKFPPNSMIKGAPAKFIRELTDEEKDIYHNHYKSYIVTKDDFLSEGFKKIK